MLPHGISITVLASTVIHRLAFAPGLMTICKKSFCEQRKTKHSDAELNAGVRSSAAADWAGAEHAQCTAHRQY